MNIFKNLKITTARWWIFASLSIIIGLYPIIYFIIDRRFGLLFNKTPELLASPLWNISFYAHITLGGVSLLIGWLQFSKKLRQNRPKLHRNIGKIYFTAVLVSSVAGLYVALFATGGAITATGFISLALIWFYTTLMGLVSIRNGDVTKHQSMLTFSYAATFAAVSLRLWLPLLIAITGDFIPAYKMVAWLCWIPNLLIAYQLNTHRISKQAAAVNA